MVYGDLALAAFLPALTFALVHLFSHRIYRYTQRHRSKMLSFFGGISAAYVFLDLLPRLEAIRIHFRTVFGEVPAFLDALAVPGLAFIGFMIFFMLEHFALSSRRNEHAEVGGDFAGVSGSKTSFLIHIGVVAFLNLVIGYVLRFEAESGPLTLIFYSAALSLHLIILDETMEQNYKKLYLKYGRYFASLMPLVGWSFSMFFPENPSEGYLLLGLILGVVLFNAIKDAVPKGGEKDTKLFITGALLYSTLLLLGAWLSS